MRICAPMESCLGLSPSTSFRHKKVGPLERGLTFLSVFCHTCVPPLDSLKRLVYRGDWRLLSAAWGYRPFQRRLPEFKFW